MLALTTGAPGGTGTPSAEGTARRGNETGPEMEDSREREATAVLRRNNITVSGAGTQALIFAHGFGCDQHMWRFVAPAFAERYRLVLFDHVGAGASDLAAYDPAKYATLQGYADDLLEICASLELHGAVFVGHSVSAMIGVLAAIAQPDRFAKLVLIGPSPCYIDDADAGYTGGFTRADIGELLDTLESNYLGWSRAMAPVIMGAPEQPELAQELTESFCRADPAIARRFARATFLSDNRADLPLVQTPALIVQCAQDVIAPLEVGAYVHGQLRDSRLVTLQTTGHCPHLSAPAATIAAMQQFLSGT